MIALGASELLLRAFFPKYQQAAESPYELDSLLAWKPTPNSRLTRRHPDTKELHHLIYNNHGLRQHRDINQEELSQSVVISVIGDSYTENRDLPSQYGFTEILDFLLNSESDQVNYQVLNFGVSGYGTDQAFIKYKTSPLAKQSAHVIYVLCSNDLGDIYNNNLFMIQDDNFLINETDRLIQLSSKKTNRVKLFLQKFHLTYLVLDAMSEFGTYSKPKSEPYKFDTHQLAKNRDDSVRRGVAQQINNKLWHENTVTSSQSMEIMNAILNELKFEVERNGGEFHIVVLPTIAAHNLSTHIPKEHRIVDLFDMFTENIPGYDWGEMTFENDGHWAEIGNMYAAIALKQYLTNESFDFSGNAEINSQLDCYYQAFGNLWRPENIPQSKKCERSKREWVKNRYIPLEYNSSTALYSQKFF